eukprot:9151654-Ditylum_brightwellii.AAC.1
MPRKDRRNRFRHCACKQKHGYINDKLGCDSRDDTKEVMREDNGVEMGENAERENNNVKEPESEEEEEEEKNKSFDVEEMKEHQEEEGVMRTNYAETYEEGNNIHDKDEEENDNEETMEDESIDIKEN